MSRTAAPEWTQIDLAHPREAWGQRITAGLLIVAGVIGFALGLPTLSQFWWELALLAFGCLLIVALGVGLWINARVSTGAPVGLKESGVRVELPVAAAFETTDEAVRYQLQLRLPEPVGATEYLVHSCGEDACVAAGRAAPNSAVPVLIDAQNRTWAVIHGSNAS